MILVQDQIWARHIKFLVVKAGIQQVLCLFLELHKNYQV